MEAVLQREQALEEQRRTHEAALGELADAHSKELERMTMSRHGDHAAALEALAKKHEGEMQEKMAEIKQHEERHRLHNEAMRANEEELRAAHLNVEEISQKYKEALEAHREAMEAHRKALGDLEEKHRGEVEDLSSRYSLTHEEGTRLRVY